ncbi:hypothetical protein ACE939_00930 [Aquimarina sp. W85]|uniref:hypothetical protein n=1 Tax=Aquimarina rhodophyticola TaxID=3342246 RepID=UPI00366AF15B
MSGIPTLQSRSGANIIKDHYIRQVLTDAAEEIFDKQSRVISNANSDYSDLLNNRSYSVTSGNLTLVHALRERFVDMKRIRGEAQRSLNVHNTIIWSQFNVVVGKLRYGFTHDIRKAIAAQYKIEL